MASAILFDFGAGRRKLEFGSAFRDLKGDVGRRKVDFAVVSASPKRVKCARRAMSARRKGKLPQRKGVGVGGRPMVTQSLFTKQPNTKAILRISHGSSNVVQFNIYSVGVS